MITTMTPILSIFNTNILINLTILIPIFNILRLERGWSLVATPIKLLCDLLL